MADFSSLSKGESLIAGNKKNDSLACKKGGGDAAKIAGAAIAGVAVAGALAVGASQTSLFSSGIGASGATQAGAAGTISGASSGVTNATGSAQNKAATAITQGPGTQSNATLNSAQGDVGSAQTDASQLAGEKRAGADGQIAQSQSSVNNAQNYLNSQTTAGQANVTAEKTLLAGKVNSALATTPPAPAGLAKPAAGKIPQAPLPVNVPPPEKVTDQSVAVPPSNLAIQAPANASVPTAKITPSSSTQQTVQDEQLKQVALSKDELDKCADQRSSVSNDLQIMIDTFNNAANAIQTMFGRSRVVGSGFSGLGTTIQFMGGGQYYNVIRPGAQNFTYPSANREYGPVIGADQFGVAAQVAITDVKYFLRCGELAVIASVTSQMSKFVATINQFVAICASWINTRSSDEVVAFNAKAIPLWKEFGGIILQLPQKYLDAANIKKGT